MIKEHRVILFFLLIVFIIMRWIVVGMEATAGGISYFVVRQTIYTLSWMSILPFVYYQTFENPFIFSSNLMRNTKIAAYAAMTGCIIKVLVTFIYQFPTMDQSLLFCIYTLAELIVWSTFAVFFYFFAKRIVKH